MENFITAAVIVVIIAAAVIYIVRSKKKGVKCIGCPSGATCGKASQPEVCHRNNCSCCSGGCAGREKSDE